MATFETAGTQNSEQAPAAESAQAGAARMKESVKAAREAAATAVRSRAQQAQGWARSQWGGLQERVEAEPYRATAWALGIGFIAGIILTGLVRGGRR